MVLVRTQIGLTDGPMVAIGCVSRGVTRWGHGRGLGVSRIVTVSGHGSREVSGSQACLLGDYGSH
jgi:hypothetical protein